MGSHVDGLERLTLYMTDDEGSLLTGMQYGYDYLQEHAEGDLTHYGPAASRIVKLEAERDGALGRVQGLLAVLRNVQTLVRNKRFPEDGCMDDVVSAQELDEPLNTYDEDEWR